MEYNIEKAIEIITNDLTPNYFFDNISADESVWERFIELDFESYLGTARIKNPGVYSIHPINMTISGNLEADAMNFVRVGSATDTKQRLENYIYYFKTANNNIKLPGYLIRRLHDAKGYWAYTALQLPENLSNLSLEIIDVAMTQYLNYLLLYVNLQDEQMVMHNCGSQKDKPSDNQNKLIYKIARERNCDPENVMNSIARVAISKLLAQVGKDTEIIY